MNDLRIQYAFYSRSRRLLIGTVLSRPGQTGFYINNPPPFGNLHYFGPVPDMHSVEFILKSQLGDDLVWGTDELTEKDRKNLDYFDWL